MDETEFLLVATSDSVDKLSLHFSLQIAVDAGPPNDASGQGLHPCDPWVGVVQYCHNRFSSQLRHYPTASILDTACLVLLPNSREENSLRMTKLGPCLSRT